MNTNNNSRNQYFPKAYEDYTTNMTLAPVPPKAARTYRMYASDKQKPNLDYSDINQRLIDKGNSFLLSENPVKDAIANYQNAANNGDKHAMYLTGACYQMQKNFGMAVLYYQQAISEEEGYAPAATALGNLYLFNSREFPASSQEAKNAVKAFTYAAERGQADAMYGLGQCYQKGYGVAKSETKARSWFIKALIAGNTQMLKPESSVYDTGVSRQKQNSNTVFKNTPASKATKVSKVTPIPQTIETSGTASAPNKTTETSGTASAPKTTETPGTASAPKTTKTSRMTSVSRTAPAFKAAYAPEDNMIPTNALLKDADHKYASGQAMLERARKFNATQDYITAANHLLDAKILYNQAIRQLVSDQQPRKANECSQRITMVDQYMKEISKRL